MEIKEAVEILADWAICSAITNYSCESCSRYSEEDAGGPCKNGVTEEEIEEALETLVGRG